MSAPNKATAPLNERFLIPANREFNRQYSEKLFELKNDIGVGESVRLTFQVIFSYPHVLVQESDGTLRRPTNADHQNPDGAQIVYQVCADDAYKIAHGRFHIDLDQFTTAWQYALEMVPSSPAK